MRNIYLLLLFLVTILNCNASLQAMQADTLYNQSYDWISGRHDTLPEWLFIPPEPGRVIAVSDPCMKPDAARSQALQRAVYLYSLQRGVRLRFLSDFFSRVDTGTDAYEDIGNKMIAMAMIQQPLRQCSYEIEQEYTSAFGEKFLKVSFSDVDSGGICCRSDSELMLLFTKERVENQEIKFILTMDAKDVDAERYMQTHFSLKGRPGNLSVESFVNGVAIDYSRKGCWYEDFCLPEAGYAKAIDMKQSFWTAYMSSLVGTLLMHPFSNTHVKQVGDNYNSGNSSKELLRERAVVGISVLPHIKAVKENKLFVEWQIVER